MDVLAIQDLTKSFGSAHVIQGISLSVPAGSVFGFIGENGAGKTTTMKMALGLLKPDGGEIRVCGEKVCFGMTGTNRQVGYLPDVPEFYPYMRPREYLRLCGEVVGLSAALIKARSDELLDLVGLRGVNKRIGSFSRGMKQRLGVAQALINEPRLLICDEPTSALDPRGRKEILDILKAISGRTTVVFSTHILSDVERICDCAAVLHKGRIALQGSLAELKAQHTTDALRIEFASSADRLRFCELAREQAQELLVPQVSAGVESAGAVSVGAEPAGTESRGAESAGAESVDVESASVELTLHSRNIAEAQTAVLQILAHHKILPVKFELLAPTIENLFLEVVR